MALGAAGPAIAQDYELPQVWQNDPVVAGAEFHEIPDEPVRTAVTLEQQLVETPTAFAERGFAEYGPVWLEGEQYLNRVVTTEGDKQSCDLVGSDQGFST